MRIIVGKVVGPQQYAYQPSIGTTDALLQLVDGWSRALYPLTKLKDFGCLVGAASSFNVSVWERENEVKVCVPHDLHIE